MTSFQGNAWLEGLPLFSVDPGEVPPANVWVVREVGVLYDIFFRKHINSVLPRNNMVWVDLYDGIANFQEDWVWSGGLYRIVPLKLAEQLDKIEQLARRRAPKSLRYKLRADDLDNLSNLINKLEKAPVLT